MKRILLALILCLTLTSCMKKERALILYYSQTGATESLALELQKQTGADIERFDVAEVYDGDYKSTIGRVLVEREEGFVPTLNPLRSSLSEYDVIYLAYPIWFGTYAPPVKALIAGTDLAGKTVVPVCTFGSGGLESSSADLAAALPETTIKPGFGIRNARIDKTAEELNRFLIENGHIPGTVEPLPEYSAQDVVIPEELAIYNEATEGYPYPMGEPVSVGSRSVPGGVDYLFTVVGTGPDGAATQGQVFVSRRNGQKTEFTKVIR